MSLEAFLNSNRDLAMPQILHVNEDGGSLEAVRSLRKEEHSGSFVNVAQLNANLTSDLMYSSILGKSSTSGFSIDHDAALDLRSLSLPTGAYLQTHGSTSFEPYISVPPVSFSSHHPTKNSSTSEVFSRLCQGRQQSRKRHHMEKPVATHVPNSESQSFRHPLPVRTKQDPGTLTPTPKKPKSDVNRENVNQKQHQIIQELLLRELQDCNQQLGAMAKWHKHQNQLQLPTFHSVSQLTGLNLQLPESQMRNLLQGHVAQQMTFPSLLDGGICSRRFMQYLYHHRNRPHDNNIAYWKKFVSEYYAPGSKKRWCFSTYDNIEPHAAGVFCPKFPDKVCCEICGSRSGKALEANFELFPRLLKLKFENGMVDEILFLDQPLACKLPSGLLVLEYRKAVQESVYEKFRVVHEGRLRIVFGFDLKILSWEFCAKKHEELLICRVLAPQVHQLLRVVQKYDNGIQNNGLPVRFPSEDLQKACNMMVSAGQNLVKDIELPLVNDLGYPKRFIRCLQISDVVHSMKDIMTLSLVKKMGPIESLNTYSQGSEISDQVDIRRSNDYGLASGLDPVSFNYKYIGQTSFVASASKGPESCLMKSSNQFQSSENGKNPHQALIDKLLHEMAVASGAKSQKRDEETITTMLKSYQNPSRSLLGEHVGNCANNKTCLTEPSSSSAASTRLSLGNASRTENNLPKPASHGHLSGTPRIVTVKTEPQSPEKLAESFWNIGGFSMIQDLQW